MVANARIYHVPALLDEVIGTLQPQVGGKYIDCTLGEGSVTEALLSSGAKVLGIDADPEMVTTAARRLASAPNATYTLVQANFASLKEVAFAQGFTEVDGIIMDVGLSSRQIQAIRRGFTFQSDQPLDMRYDPRQEVTAADLVNDLPEQELVDLFMTYGDEDPWSARAIARTVIGRRPLESTRELVECIDLAVGQRSAARIHPATKVFMALRIVVNADLQALESALPQALDLLAPGGRLAVIGYQSLEDRIIKRFLHQEARNCLCPPAQPVCTCDHTASIKLLRRQGITPSLAEISRNPASRSARLRIAERIAA